MLGTHEHHSLAHVIVGGVVEKVLRIAPCPVLVVPLASPLTELRMPDPLAESLQFIPQEA